MLEYVEIRLLLLEEPKICLNVLHNVKADSKCTSHFLKLTVNKKWEILEMTVRCIFHHNQFWLFMLNKNKVLSDSVSPNNSLKSWKTIFFSFKENYLFGYLYSSSF